MSTLPITPDRNRLSYDFPSSTPSQVGADQQKTRIAIDRLLEMVINGEPLPEEYDIYENKNIDQEPCPSRRISTGGDDIPDSASEGDREDMIRCVRRITSSDLEDIASDALLLRQLESQNQSIGALENQRIYDVFSRANKFELPLPQTDIRDEKALWFALELGKLTREDFCNACIPSKHQHMFMYSVPGDVMEKQVLFKYDFKTPKVQLYNQKRECVEEFFGHNASLIMMGVYGGILGYQVHSDEAGLFRKNVEALFPIMSLCAHTFKPSIEGDIFPFILYFQSILSLQNQHDDPFLVSQIDLIVKSTRYYTEKMMQLYVKLPSLERDAQALFGELLQIYIRFRECDSPKEIERASQKRKGIRADIVRLRAECHRAIKSVEGDLNKAAENFAGAKTPYESANCYRVYPIVPGINPLLLSEKDVTSGRWENIYSCYKQLQDVHLQMVEEMAGHVRQFKAVLDELDFLLGAIDLEKCIAVAIIEKLVIEEKLAQRNAEKTCGKIRSETTRKVTSLRKIIDVSKDKRRTRVYI